MSKLSALTSLPVDLLASEQGCEVLETWLFRTKKDSIIPVMDKFLTSVSNVPEMPMMPPKESRLSLSPIIQGHYRGIDGLRQAVIRFLTNASSESGELWLYSDESMSWLAGDASFFATWKMLMAACINKGVTIKIIHNIDRSLDEMFDAISGWLPLYVSGRIEPFVCRRPRDSRFSHTFFLRPGKECIYGMNVNDAPCRRYDYITDSEDLDDLVEEYKTLLSSCESLVKVHTEENLDAVLDMLDNDDGYHILEQPYLPFRDIRIIIREKSISVIRSKPPCAAFSFTDPYVVYAFHEYRHSLHLLYSEK